MSHDRHTAQAPHETPPLHAGFFESVVCTAYLLTAVIVLAPVVMLFPKRNP